MGGVIHLQGNSEGGRRGRRDGRTEEWRNGDISVDTSVLIAVSGLLFNILTSSKLF